MPECYRYIQTGISKWDASDKGFDLTGTVTESGGSSFVHREQLSQSSEDLMRMEQGRKVGVVKFEASSKEEMSRESNRAFQATHSVGRQFTINQAEDKVKTNHNWMDKQINSRSEHREYAAPTSAPPTTMTALRTTSPGASQSLLGNAPSGSQLVSASTHTTFYFSPLADVTKTVKNWIESYNSDGSPNAAPILYRFLDEVKVNVGAWVTKTGYDFNGSTTLRSKATFDERDNGTIYDYRGLNKVIEPPSAENNQQATTRFEESRAYGQPSGITQNITHTKPSGDNTITIPNQGTTTTVAPGGEHYRGTSTLTTYLTVQKPMADFVGQFTTKTGYSSPPPSTTTGSGANEGDYSQEGGGGTQGDGPNSGGNGSTINQEIAETTAEIELLMKEGLAKVNQLSFEDLMALSTGVYQVYRDDSVGRIGIKPTRNAKWFIFDSEVVGVVMETHYDELRMPYEVPTGGRVVWNFTGVLPINFENAISQNKTLKSDLQSWNGAANATEFALHLVPFGNFVDNRWGHRESVDSDGYIALVFVGDCLIVGGIFIKSGTRGAKIVNALGVAENLVG
ncbi:MAG: hypothetical protein JNL67_02850, partial [Planctomycetaceae bacterium]|nr:hypothetical protein [Planctomycetaceae bacterium]